MSDKTTKIVAGHAMAVRDKKREDSKEDKLYSQDITQKEFGGAKNASWKNREMDWYNAERRFIFATHTATLRDEWVGEIKKDMVFNGSLRTSTKEIIEIVSSKRN